MQNLHRMLTKTLALACFAAIAHAGQIASASAKTSASASASAGAVTLNQKDIHAAYNEGDFDKVTTLIEAFNKANKTYSRADSVFIAKHLAVVYTANPQTREKGKYYMYRLLEMMPSAELVDMFVSDEIDRIFDKVRKEFIARQQGFGVDSTQISTPSKPASHPAAAATTGTASAAPAQPAKGPSQDYLAADKHNDSFWKRNGFWIAGGVGLAVAGTVAYFIIAQDQPSSGKTINIPAETTAQH